MGAKRRADMTTEELVRARERDRIRDASPARRETRRAYDASPARRAKERIRDRLRTRPGHRRRELGITLDGWNRMWHAQGGLCAICRTAQATQVDHDHANGMVRGALCGGCNSGLGGFNDNQDLLRAAIPYLEHWRGRHAGVQQLRLSIVPDERLAEASG
jgi:hypothetical protein